MIGFVLVDKPPGPTSHDVVDAVRRSLRVRRVGHAGTLDPPASGLVVVGIGPATRLLRFVQQLAKTYETEAVLGTRTTTLDAEGDVVAEAAVDVTEDDLRAVADAFVGEIEQTPPAVSAVKVGGERAYRRAARGEDVDLTPRHVHIYELNVEELDSPMFRLRVRCSSGTYIRTLVADIGDRLGCGAHVRALRRTAIGSLDVAEAVAPDQVAAETLIPVEEGLRDLPQVRVDGPTAERAGHGQRIALSDAGPGSREVLLTGPQGAVGIFEAADDMLRPVTVLAR